MAENKTRPTELSVQTFLEQVPDEARRADAFALLDLMQSTTGLPPVMWGDAIIGFGSIHYQYASGREGDMPAVSFSPRKQNLALYRLTGSDQAPPLLEQLGKYKLGKGCLYINRLADVNLDVLAALIRLAMGPA